MRDAVRFVLVRPGSGGNVGAAARALKNMGFAALDLVDPRPFEPGEAERLAHNATDVLTRARHLPSLAAAVADCRWVVGTTRRSGRRRRATLAPRDFAALAGTSHAARRPLAIVFGPEADGLAATDLALCHDIVQIPADRAQPSLNLAQALLILAYELRLAGCGNAPPPAAHPRLPEASAAELEQLYLHLEAALLAVQFVRPDTAPHRILALRRLLGRARPQPSEVRLLRGICRQMLWAATARPASSNSPKRAATARTRRRPVSG
jgi:tRNA (cytidine32/uridine32-2'-O)-methyltransferase